MYFAGSTRTQYFEGPPFFCPGCRNYCLEGGDKYHQRSTIKSFMTIILTGRAARPQRGGLSLYPLPYRWKLRRIFTETGQDSGFDAALASRLRHTICNGYMELLLIKLFLTPLLMLTISWSAVDGGQG